MNKFVGGLSTSGIFERCVYLINLLFYFQAAVWMVEVFHKQLDLSDLFLRFIVFVILLRTYISTLKALQYSFWSISIFLFLYVFNGFTSYLIDAHWTLMVCYFLLMGLLVAIMYLMSSPLFYPRIRWWESDVRITGELKVKIKQEDGEEVIEARLTDLRREAGCLVLFPDVEIGKEFSLDIFEPPFPTHIKIKMMCRRPVAPGRGFAYGVKFLTQNVEEKKIFKALKDFWINFKRESVQKKLPPT